jgi:hypothetical protein
VVLLVKSTKESTGKIWKYEAKYVYLSKISSGYVLIHCYGSETGEFCAIKEVEFVRDDPKSKESAKQLAQVSKNLSILSVSSVSRIFAFSTSIYITCC